MKKIVFGVALLVSGVVGVAFSMLSVATCTEALGTINDSSNMFAYLGWYGMTPIFICFVLMALSGIAICIKEIYFSNHKK